jgi:hypothetical protein
MMADSSKSIELQKRGREARARGEPEVNIGYAKLKRLSS